MNVSPRQQQTIAAALTVVSGGVIIAALLGSFWALSLFLDHFSHVFLPLAVAGVGALIVQPYYDWLRARMPMPVAVVALFLSVLAPLLLFLGSFGMIAIKELADLIAQIPKWWQSVMSWGEANWPALKEFFAENPVGKRIVEGLKGQGPLVAATLEYVATKGFAAGSTVADFTGAMLSWVVTPVYFVFFLIMKRKDVAQLEDILPFLKEETRGDVLFLLQEFINIMVAFFRGQFIIALAQGVLLSIGFSVVGLKYGLVLGLLLGFLNVIPYLGSMLGLMITLPLAYFQEGGGLGTLAMVITVFAVVSMIEGYILTPKIMGDRTGLHPMAIIFAIFFWGAALGGILGMILAIPLTAFLVVFWRLAKEKYIPEVV